MKRALAAVVLLSAAAAIAYGYSVTRQERLYRQLLLQGDTALARGDAFGGVAAFSEAIALRPETMVGYLKRGEAHKRRGDLDRALADLQRAVALDGAAPRAFELLGDVESAREAHEAAAGHYAASIRLDDRPRVLYKLGLARYLAGHTAAAAEALTSAVALDGRFAEAQYLLGVCLRELGDSAEAESAFARALALAPRLTAAREQLAEVYGQTGRRGARISQLERLAVDPGGPPRQVSLALAYGGAGQTSRAVRVLRTLTERHPDDPGVYLALGRLWLEAAQTHEDRVELGKAIEALEQAAALEPSGTIFSELARAYQRAGNGAAAAEALERASETLPADPHSLLRLADSAARAGDRRRTRDALIKYHALCEPSVRPAGLAQRIADLSMELREPERAAHWYAAAADGPRSHPSLLLKLAGAQRQAGQLDAARRTLDRLLEQDPGNAAAREMQMQVR